MKKILLSLVTVLSISAYAQKDIEAFVIEPETNFQSVEGDTTFMRIGMINTGDEDIAVDDTLLLQMYIGPIQLQFGPNQSVASYTLNSPLAPDDTLAFGRFYVIPDADFINTLDTSVYEHSVCGRVNLLNNGIVTETDMDNNYACNTQFGGDVSIDEIERVNTINVSPNPVIDNMNLSVSMDAVLNVQDVTGRVVLTESLLKGENTVSTSSLNAGNYIFTISTDKLFLGSGKFVK